MSNTSKSTNKQGWRKGLAVHEAANLFPRMSESELAELGEDVKHNGLRVPIAYRPTKTDSGDYEIQLLDGINRLDAMEQAAIPFSLIPNGGELSIS
jgi:hypothetical protein